MQAPVANELETILDNFEKDSLPKLDLHEDVDPEELKNEIDELKQVLGRLSNEAEQLRQKETRTEEEEKQLLAVNAVIEANKKFLASCKEIAEIDASSHDEKADAFRLAHLEYVKALSHVSYLSDSATYFAQLAALLSFSLLLNILISTLLLTLATLPPVLVALISIGVVFSVLNTVYRVITVLDEKNLIGETAIPIPGTKQWSAAIESLKEKFSNWVKSFFSEEDKKNIEDATSSADAKIKLYQFLTNDENMLHIIRSTIFGDFGLYMEGRDLGLKIAGKLYPCSEERVRKDEMKASFQSFSFWSQEEIDTTSLDSDSESDCYFIPRSQ